MERHSIQEYMHIGAMNWHLVRLADGVKAKGQHGAHQAIADLKASITKADLKVALRAGAGLWALLEELEKLQPTDAVSQAMLQEIRAQSASLEKTLVAESSGKVVFVVTEKRIDIEKLLDNHAGLLAPGVWLVLPRISWYDFSDACKSIAFEMPTSAAFHILRCLEGVIRQYYKCIIKRDRLDDTDQMWGPMVKQIREKKRDKPPQELLDSLDRIRVSFRNPTSHPDKVYDSDEAQDLFNLCVDAINRIVRSKQWSEPADSINRLIQAIERQKEAAT